MSSYQDRICVRILVHGSLQALGQILFKRSILDDWNSQSIMISQVAGLLKAFTEAFDLLNVVDLEHACVWLAFEEERDEDSPLGMRMNATARISFGKGSYE